MLRSALFRDDPILESVANDQARISRTQNNVHDTVQRVQFGLLARRPDCLPTSGADGDYGDETAGAVLQLKMEEFPDLPADQLIDDVGPRTVLLLDALLVTRDFADQMGVLAICTEGITDEQAAGVRAAIDASGGVATMGLGERGVVVAGGPPVEQALAALIGAALDVVITPSAPQLPAGLDDTLAELVGAWLAMLDPAFVLATTDESRFGESLGELGSCIPEVAQ